jgi:hypothetical protein
MTETEMMANTARRGKYEELDRQSIPDRFTGHQETLEDIKDREDDIRPEGAG